MNGMSARAGAVGLVALGGGVGAACREGVCLLIPSVAGAPAAIPVVNVVGAFLLGYLTASLARAGTPPPPLATRLKLLLGTGFCGGFTTYSSLATDAAVLLDHSRFGAAAVYLLATVLLGALATIAGILLAGHRHGRHTRTGGAPA